MGHAHRGNSISVTTSVDPTTLPQFARDYRGGSFDGPEHLDDELTAGALDFSRRLDGPMFNSLQFGARLSNRTKKHDRFEFFPQAPAGGVLIPAELFRVYQVKSVNLPPVLLGDYDQIARIAYGEDALDLSNAEENLALRWKVKEEVSEGYLKFNFESSAVARRMSGNIGVRLVDVQTTSDGYQQADRRQRTCAGDHRPRLHRGAAERQRELQSQRYDHSAVRRCRRSSRVRRWMNCAPAAR